MNERQATSNEIFTYPIISFTQAKMLACFTMITNRSYNETFFCSGMNK